MLVFLKRSGTFHFLKHIISITEKNGGTFMLTLSISGFLAFLSSAIFVVGYISNNNLFPEPLSAEEEKMYLEKMRRRR